MQATQQCSDVCLVAARKLTFRGHTGSVFMYMLHFWKLLKITGLITAPLLTIRTMITKLLYRGQGWVSPFSDASHRVLSPIPQGLFQEGLHIIYLCTLGAQQWGLAYRRNSVRLLIEILSDCGNLGLNLHYCVKSRSGKFKKQQLENMFWYFKTTKRK